ncbi:MAG: SMP-30/gluconolactonase/LRE family protein [Pseudarcicella sp.]|nr:SMP-30/gluconolactonase/LRE family protein [Pseudarcicella sp.]
MNKNKLFLACIFFLGFQVNAQDNSKIFTKEKNQPDFDKIILPSTQIEVLSKGHNWLEGPVWDKINNELLFNDVPKNTTYSWKEDVGLAIFLRPSGFYFAGNNGPSIGANGMELDKNNNLILCEHGTRSITRLNRNDFTKETLVDSYQSKKLNSPNDLIFNKKGEMFFTDPPYGLKGGNSSPLKEQPHNGVYKLDTLGKITLLTTEMTMPNGIALSIDERKLYVSQSDVQSTLIKEFEFNTDGSLTKGKILHDGTKLKNEGKKGLCDGLAVDKVGNIFATGPGGVWILNSKGEMLGYLTTGLAMANCTFGPDGYLYITAGEYLARVKTETGI